MFVNLGQTWVLLIGGIGIVGALIVLANLVADDAKHHDLRGGSSLYWFSVFFLAPVGMLVWLAGTYRKIDHERALARATGVAVFNIVWASAAAASAAARFG